MSEISSLRTTTKRVNIRITEDMHQWFKVRSEQTGVPSSSLMALALEEHIRQIKITDTLPVLMDKVEELQKKLNE